MARQGLSAFLGQTLAWVQHQRCVWHVWRNLAGQLAHAAAQAAAAAAGDVAEAIREQVRAELVALMHGVIDAQSYEQAEAALVTLRSHPQGAAIAQFLNEHLDHILVHLVAYYAGPATRDAGMVLARLPPPPQPRPQSSLRPALGAGGAGLGHLPQLRARPMEV